MTFIVLLNIKREIKMIEDGSDNNHTRSLTHTYAVTNGIKTSKKIKKRFSGQGGLLFIYAFKESKLFIYSARIRVHRSGHFKRVFVERLVVEILL